MENKPTLSQSIKNRFLGKPRDPKDRHIFRKLSLIAFFAWIGLGADGLSSSCYGPQESFLALKGHFYLSIFVAIGTVITISVIASSYSQIVELFPHGGGGYVVASKLLSPTVGMISGCALLIDYVLTITVSIASGADAIFSFLPADMYKYRIGFALLVVLILIYLNMRGVKESVVLLTPIFLTFIITHVFIIILAFIEHLPNVSLIAAATKADVHSTVSQVGIFGMLFLILHSYSMGAGTYTGLEAVSNGIPILREPQADTAKRTMRYMAISLSFVVMGLMLAYIFYGITQQHGKTLNAILLENIAGGWGKLGLAFILITLISEATLLFVAAQTGFLDGPRVLANMALDRWFPTRFAYLSDRLVMQRGVLIMGGLSALLIVLSRASVRFLVILYSINVFITFVLSQTGMVRHWWVSRKKVKNWFRKISVNGIGLVLCAFILISMVAMKFNEGGWITLFITATLVILAILTKRHYDGISRQLRRLNSLITATELDSTTAKAAEASKLDSKAKTAVLVVTGFNGLGLHTLFGVIRSFGGVFKNFVFIEVGIVNAGNFKGASEIGNLENQVESDLNRYVNFMNRQGFFAEGIKLVGVDMVEEVSRIAPEIAKRFPSTVFFGGQLLFEKESLFSPLFHNYAVFALQKLLYKQGILFVILPIKV